MVAGGESVYLLAESVEAQGYLQVRKPALGSTYRLLVAEHRTRSVAEALWSAGLATAEAHPGPLAGWRWFEDIVFTSSLSDHVALALGLVALAPPGPAASRGWPSGCATPLPRRTRA